LSKVRKLNEIAQSREQTLAQMSLAWVLRHEVMTSVLIGASKMEQIEDAVGTLKHLEFTTSELEQIEVILG
jgi:L-glyceraldehyde 3-phosphate reductase